MRSLFLILLLISTAVRAEPDATQATQVDLNRGRGWLIPGYVLGSIGTSSAIAGAALLIMQSFAHRRCAATPRCFDESGMIDLIGICLVAIGAGLNLFAIPAVIVGIRERVHLGLELEATANGVAVHF